MQNEKLSKDTYREYFGKGVDFETYLKNMKLEILSKPTYEKAKYLPLNLHRTKKWLKNFKVDPAFNKCISKEDDKILWLVITETWCGDASQIVPIIHKLAVASDGIIDLRLIKRDDNPELMNAHLTNGSRSIPKLLQFDTSFNLTGTWGPRPKVAQDLVMTLKSNPETAATYSHDLHKWYALDRGISVQNELEEMVCGMLVE
ncbi:MAG: thioredoxin family protein [Flavobacteriales bacterium]|nr:thioredoxin family protein [Flavobacteriales bacterium]